MELRLLIRQVVICETSLYGVMTVNLEKEPVETTTRVGLNLYSGHRRLVG